jgi:NTE family protein
VSSPRRVAIACQGGGSHTAFTAGVLRGLLDADELRDLRIVGLSGTSGGAVCALLTWYTLRDGDPAAARDLLAAFWAENAANGPVDQAANAVTLWAATLQGLGMLPAVSPYDTPVSDAASAALRDMLESCVDFDTIDVDEDAAHPMLLLGAVDVLTGAFRTFNSRRDRITADMILASAAIPSIFRSVRVGDELLWDGLFSQNPPVRELLDAEPDELWVIQINPQSLEREPRTVLEIADRRNELAGNLSLLQELGFIEKIDQLLDAGALTPAAGYRQVVVRIIELPRSGLRGVGAISKLDRDPGFLEALMTDGERKAVEFLAALRLETTFAARDPDAMLELFTDDACVHAESPFPEGEHRGEALRRFVSDQLAAQAEVDLTHKQVAGDRVTWTLRVRDGERPRRAIASAEFRAGKVAELRVGGAP